MRAALKVEIATPLSIGYYDPNLLDSRFYIRPTSIKGLWRWWARAFVGGVLYERGCIKARRDRHRYMVPDRNSADIIAKTTGLTLGLGYAGAEKSAASRFRITVKTIRHPSVCKAKYRQRDLYRQGRYLSLQRFNLLTLNNDVEYADGGEFEINIDAPGVDKDTFQAAVGILTAALTLTGLGKGSRKGLGCLDILRVDGDFSAEPLERLINDVRSALERLIRDDCQTKPNDLPPLPVVSKAKVHEVNITTIFRSDISFENLHNFFSRPHRAKVLKKKPDFLRQNLNAWVLGLPRGQKEKRQVDQKENGQEERRKRGYIIDTPDLDRRASTFMTCYHFSHLGLQQSPAGYLTVLISGDWPTNLTWIGAGRQRIPIDTQRILAAYRDALNEFEDYVKGIGGTMVKIWP